MSPRGRGDDGDSPVTTQKAGEVRTCAPGEAGRLAWHPAIGNTVRRGSSPHGCLRLARTEKQPRGEKGGEKAPGGQPTGRDSKFRDAAKMPNRDLCKEVETEVGKALEISRISPLASFLIAG